jgi:hypothetical protein
MQSTRKILLQMGKKSRTPILHFLDCLVSFPIIIFNRINCTLDCGLETKIAHPCLCISHVLTLLRLSLCLRFAL